MSDEEQPLPDGWEEAFNEAGEPFYFDKNDMTPPVWVRPTEPTPKLPPGWAKVKGDNGVYYHNNLSQRIQTEFPVAGQAFDAEHRPSDVGVEQPQQTALNIPMPDNIILTETERALINSMQDGAALLVKIDEYDGEFEKLKGLLASPEAQPFNLSVYTEKLEAFRLLLIEKLKSLKDRIVSISNLAGLSTSLIKKLEQAKVAYQSIAAKLSAATNPAEYKALGVKIAELERLLDDSHPSVGGRRRSKTKHRKYRGKKTKTKRVKQTKTRKIKRKGGKCNCSLWSK